MNTLSITLRKETPADWKETENLTREAFWDVYQPGCDEHVILRKLRGSSVCIEEATYVAVDDTGRIVGHIFYNKAKLVYDGGAQTVAAFGPISVLPEMQHRGVGSALIRATLPIVRDLGYPGVTITGNPAYYHRFGFTDAKAYALTLDDGFDGPEFMAIAFQENAFHPGRLFFDEAYTISPEELAAVEADYPHKNKREKRETDLV